VPFSSGPIIGSFLPINQFLVIGCPCIFDSCCARHAGTISWDARPKPVNIGIVEIFSLVATQLTLQSPVVSGNHIHGLHVHQCSRALALVHWVREPEFVELNGRWIRGT
jgi:hypothetical protein